MVNRFREELPRLGVEAAVIKAVTTTGRAVTFSGITVAASLVGLFAFPQMFLRSMAIGGIAVSLGAVALAVTLLPALLGIFGTHINALKVPGVRTHVKDASGPESPVAGELGNGDEHKLTLVRTLGPRQSQGGGLAPSLFLPCAGAGAASLTGTSFQ